MIWGWIAGVLAALVLLVCSSFIYVRLRYRHIGRDDDLVLQIKALFGMIRYTYKSPVIRFRGWPQFLVSSFSAGQDGGEPKEVALDLHKIRIYLKRSRMIKENTWKWNEWQWKTMRKLRCTRLSWYTRVGARDAAVTAITAGALWACKSMAVGWMANRIRMDAVPDLDVTPSFREPTFHMELSIDGNVRVASALYAALDLAWRIARVRGGPRAWAKLLFARTASKSGPAAKPNAT